MDLIQLIVVLAIIGLVWWLATNYIPMPQPMKVVITAVAVIGLCIFLLQWAGLTHFALARR